VSDDETPSDMPDNVLRLVFKIEDDEPPQSPEPVEPPTVIKANFGQEMGLKEPDRSCFHHTVYVIKKTRMLQCQICEATIDPFDRLLEYAHKERNHKHRDQERRDLSAKLEALREEESRTKQRIKAAKKRDVDEAVLAERKRNIEVAKLTLKQARIAIVEMRKVRRAMLRLLGDEAIALDDTDLMREVVWSERSVAGDDKDAEKLALARFRDHVKERGAQ